MRRSRKSTKYTQPHQWNLLGIRWRECPWIRDNGVYQLFVSDWTLEAVWEQYIKLKMPVIYYQEFTHKWLGSILDWSVCLRLLCFLSYLSSSCFSDPSLQPDLKSLKDIVSFRDYYTIQCDCVSFARFLHLGRPFCCLLMLCISPRLPLLTFLLVCLSYRKISVPKDQNTCC